MGASITLAGEDLIAQKQIAQEGLEVVRFIFANVPGLDHTGPVDRAAGLPDAGQIVYTATIPAENKGYVNPSQVVYSAQIGSDVGDWDFNWIGLETAENVLFAVSYVPLQQKRRNIPPLQIGNNLTRNFLVVFDGAQALTGITIDASTWQHDFTVRLAGIDERERLSNRDVYGRACFFGTSLQLEKVGGAYQLKPGTAYIEGIRLALGAALPVVPDAVPGSAWLDVALQRELNDVVASWEVVWGAGLVDYVDTAGVQHYLVQIADLPDINTVADLRSVEPIEGALVEHFAARTGDYEGLRARATTKEDVDLGNLPNAKSDDPSTDSSDILATTKCVKQSEQQVLAVMVGQISAFARTAAPTGWLKANGAAISRTAYTALFASIGTTFGAGDGSTTFNLPDLRGQFLRGWDDSRGLDAGRSLGTDQADDNKSHNHTAATSSDSHNHTVSGSTSNAGSHTHSITANGGTGADSSNPYGAYRGNGSTGTDSSSINAVGNHSHTWSGTTTSDSHSHTVTIGSNGGAESRPKNVALLFCIKY